MATRLTDDCSNGERARQTDCEQRNHDTNPCGTGERLVVDEEPPTGGYCG